ncbi:MAG: HemK2/MTQ2 family protein methyltransferase [Patescibacteria group bacterium]
MSKLSLKLQAKSLAEMATRKPYIKKLSGFEYKVLPKVYKGSTDTELICHVLKINKNDEVWDIGTGTGLIALNAKKKGAKYVLATDLNPNALKNAKENSRLLNMEIDVKKADVFGNIRKKFDVIIFNPPFTDNLARKSHEISFWDQGHKTTKRYLKGVSQHLKPNGRAYIAWSSFGNVRKLKRLAENYGLILKEMGKKKGKRSFVYYVFQVLT